MAQSSAAQTGRLIIVPYIIPRVSDGRIKVPHVMVCSKLNSALALRMGIPHSVGAA